MKLTKSTLGTRIASTSGIEVLMDDLGKAMAEGGENIKMLGGGNPAQIPAVSELWRKRMAEILAEPGQFERMLGNYDPPAGNAKFIEALAALLQREYGWNIAPENIAVTGGGQVGFFYLFNLLAGEMPEGSIKRVLLPVVPEYIGYANQGACGNIFDARHPVISHPEPHRFKYGIDFEKLDLDPAKHAAVCLSRPTNPTGNVITDQEVDKLSALCKESGIPLIIDGAYGTPFPNIMFTEANPIWDEHIILTLSLSKIGLPGTRTAVVIANKEIAAAVRSQTAIVGLANGNVGQVIMRPLIESGEVLTLSNDIVKPFYKKKSDFALNCVDEFLDDSMDYHIHVSEGALFLWFWFRNLPITTQELYQRLKERDVLVVPGEYFFFGLPDEAEEPWRHRHECIRVSFAMPEEKVREGIRIIGEEAKAAYAAG